jgi:NAD(P)-dependent dehydrogenase (short-subunit alcohol dehydrogenase family)
VVIVTGGARGIGSVYAKGIAAQGAKVVVSDIRDGSSVAEEIRKGGGEAVFLEADVSSGKSADALAEAAHREFGRIDGLVNNAALYADLKYIPFDEIAEEEWDRVFAVNVKGVWLMTKAVFPYMREQGSGKIVNIASGTPFKGTPKTPHYVVSKGAVVTLTRVMARTVGKEGICVNCVAPGLTRSDSVLAARADVIDAEDEKQIQGRAIPRSQVPEDLIGAIVFFLSGGADFITGQTLPVDGGSHMN